MAAYIVALVWLISHFVCIYILRKRLVKVRLLAELVGVLLGPLAIPLAFFVGSKSHR